MTLSFWNLIRCVLALPFICCLAAAQAQPFQASGVKVGEVTPHTAIVWTRLTKTLQSDPETYELSGSPGQARLRYWLSGHEAEGRRTDWFAVDPRRDFTYQFALGNLSPNANYEFCSEARNATDAGPSIQESTRRPNDGKPVTSAVTGRFQTAPLSDTPASVTFTVVTGQDYHRRDDGEAGHRIYKQMLVLQPRFFVHTGDIVYYDKPDPVARNIGQARAHWHRIYSLPNQREFHCSVPAYFIKDDHDTLKNDCWPGQRKGLLTWEDGLALFREQVPMGERTYRTFRWGRDLQIWLVEGRDFRSPNTMTDGPNKTIWGREQIAWFKETVLASDATFRILVSPTPIVGPDRPSKNDNHANRGFTHEGRKLRRFLAEQEMFVVCGDRHWQYVSVDPETGLREYSCGPTTDKHAGGFLQQDRSPMHEYLKIQGGFLSVTIKRMDDAPVAMFRHHGVSGQIDHEDRQPSS